jgi:uncharacterized membrane protein YqaE (UPF0057 family)
MKNVFTLTLILVATSIMFSSCSQLSNTTRMKSYSSSAINIESASNEKSGPLNEETNSYQVKGFSSDRQNIDEEKDSIIENNTAITTTKTLLTGSVSSYKENQKNSIANVNNSDVKSENGKPTEIISESRDKSGTELATGSSNNSGHGAHGVPFWFIVICSIIIPPLGVALMFGIDDRFWICLALTLLFWLPGMIYALFQIF